MKLFVWDFHGVLEKGNDDAVVEITNMALQRHGFARRMTSEEGHVLSGKRWYEYFAYLVPEATSPGYLELQATCIDISLHQPEIIAKHIKLNDHADHVLQTIADSPHQQILLSNTQPKSLDLFVRIVGIETYFPPGCRFGVDSHTHQARTKRDFLSAFVKDKSFPGGVVTIGDSPSDMELVHAGLPGRGYLYTHPGLTHRPAQCHHRIHDLRAVLPEVAPE